MVNKKCQYFIYLIFLLLPFERLATFEVLNFTIKPAYVLSLLLIIWFVISYFTKYCFITRLKSLISDIALEEYFLFSLVLWSFISSLWSLAPYRTIIYSTLLFLMATIFMILRRCANNEIKKMAVNIIVWLGIGVSILAIIQFVLEPVLGYKLALLREQYGSRVFGFPRPHATFLEPLYMANFLLFPILLKMNYELRIMNNGKVKNIQYSIFNIQAFRRNFSLIIMLTAFVLALSRGAYLSLVVGILILISALIIKKKINWQSVASVILIAVVSISISLIMIYAVAGKAGLRNFCNQVFRVRDLTPTNEIEILKNRDLSRQIAWQSIRDRPLSGIGLATFGALSQYQFLRENGEWQTVNNQYLEIVVELGLVGLMIFLAIVFLAIRYQVLAVGNGKYENVVYLGWLLAVLVQYLTFSTLYLLYIWIFLAIIWPTNKQDLA